MGNTESTPTKTQEPATATKEKPKCKACCACPETKKIRDECVLQNGEENCGDVIANHIKCMRDLGFKI